MQIVVIPSSGREGHIVILPRGTAGVEREFARLNRRGFGSPRLSFEADDLVKIIEGKCYKMLSEIRDIIRDKSLDDPECFMKIDSIVSLFIREGISTNGRNDF